MKHLTVFITVPTESVAEDLSRALVSERLVACVNIVPAIRSLYWWEGKICDDKELLLIAKTTDIRFQALRDRVVELHPYDTPEIVALPIIEGHEPYLTWIESSTAVEAKE